MDSKTKQTYVTSGGNVEANPFESNEIVALYFSAHWCPPCRGFTPVLAQFYKDVNENGKKLEIIFVTSDKDEAAFKDYFATMPWVALPFGDTRIGQLKQQHNVTGIPCLVVLKKDGSVLVANGRGDVTSSGVKAFENWVAASK